MSILDQRGSVERLRFFDGQRLAAADLQDLDSFHRAMRELHNRSLHQPGIGNGFAVSGERGDREVTIGPGYALDAAGQEIVLTESRVEPVPPVEAEEDGSPVFFDLTVSYPADEDLEEAETREGVCLPRGVTRLSEEPVFCWVRLVRELDRLRATDERLGQDVLAAKKLVLARAEVQHCQLNKLTLAQRRSARPPQQPHLACGRATPAWKAVDIPAGDNALFSFFLTAEIDTRRAGFLTTPCYSARIEGPRTITASTGPVETDGGGVISAAVLVVAEPLASVDGARPDGFTLRVLPILSPPVPPEEFLNGLGDAWQVVWMGIE